MVKHYTNRITFTVWLRNRMISAILKNHIFHRIADNFNKHLNKNHKITTSFVRPGLSSFQYPWKAVYNTML